MKVYALLATIGSSPGFSYQIFAVTHAGSLEMACRKFRVEPVERGYWPHAVKDGLPLPPKAENPEFVEVKATEESAAEAGHALSIPRLFGFMINMGAWVCELPTID